MTWQHSGYAAQLEAVARRMVAAGVKTLTVPLSDGQVARIQIGSADEIGAAEIRESTERQMRPIEEALEVAIDEARKLLGELPPEPPPGAMRVTASVPVTYDVSPGQIAAYLQAKGWEHQTGPYWHKGEWGMSWLPSDRPSDLNEWLLRSLSKQENRSTGEVLRDIAGMEEA